MLSRRSIFLFSVGVALALYAAFLYIAPRVILIETDSLAARAATRFHVAFIEPARERRDIVRPGETPGPAEVEAVFGDAPGMLPVEDALVGPPVETPRLHERAAGEPMTREYDLAAEEARQRKMDARILEITQNVARRDMDIARRLVRPSPEYALPEGALPALRSRDIGEDQIPLEPARTSFGLLAQAMPMADEDTEPTPPERPPFEATPIEAPPDIAQLERATVTAPVTRETATTRQESPYTFLDDMVDIRLDVYAPSDQSPGYFRLRILPRPNTATTPLPRDLVFVIDASRSMQQRKIDLVGRGITDALDGFNAEDRFNILLFRDTATMFRPETVPATPANLDAARQFLAAIEARGQTDIYNALTPVARQTPRHNLPGIILVISDGNPTTGLRDSRAIINAVTADNALRNSIFAFGAGRTVNRYLLDLLAYRNKGEAHVADRIEDTREQLHRFIEQLNHPLLVNLSADYGRVDRDTVFPRVLPDFYLDKPIHIYGRFDPASDAAFVARVTGRAAEKHKELVFRADFSAAGVGGADIAQAWAFQKAYHLIGEISRRGDQPELLAELRRLSERYNIRTIYDE